MLTREKSPELVRQLGLENKSHEHRSKLDRKWQRILRVFLAGRSLHRFEAERIGDHTLHSTVSFLQTRGVTILRKEETVTGYGGHPTRVMRYRLAPESCERARELLNGTRQSTAGQNCASTS